MASLCRWMLVLTTLLAAGLRVGAATSAENRAFDAAARDFRAGFYDRAEAGFADFARTFTNSTRRAEAVLYQAEARLKRTDYKGAAEVLLAGQAQAGKWAPEYLFWLAQAQSQDGAYQAAGDTFARLVQQFPASPRCLEAVVGQATACSKLHQWPRVVELLQQTNGLFQSAARTNAASEWTLRGRLLLGEALFARQDYRAAESALEPLTRVPLNPEIDWQRQYLLCRIQLGDQRPEQALQGTTNLLRLAASTGWPDLQAQSAAFRASLFERLGQLDAAIAAYTNNLATGVPAQLQRQALLEITKLALAQSRVGEAVQMLERFLAQYPDAPAADVALLTLGELQLRQHLTGPAGPVTAPATNTPVLTDPLRQATARLQELSRRFPKSALVPEAQLDLGWCFWLDGKLSEAQASFQSAVDRLPPSLDQATAFFKLADAQFQQKNFIGAVANYSNVVGRFSGLPEVRTNLFEPALYQTVQAACAAGDLVAASNAMARILAWFPNGFLADRAVLLAGQEIRRQNPGGARRIFLNFIKAAPGAPLVPEVKLAIARTFEQQNQWTNAIQQYSDWLANYTNNIARPLAEYYRAQACSEAHLETNALTFFTNLVARFPSNEFSRLGQLWVADYFFRTGNYRDAELNYQLLFQNTNWPTSDLTYQARMMAGRAAVAQQLWNDARTYFTNLTSDLQCPGDLRVQAMSAYGDTLMSQDSTNKLADYVEAIKVYSLICESYPTNRLAVLAMGQKANALFQLSQYPHQSEEITNALDVYWHVVDSAQAEITARSMAKVGMAVVLEKQAEQSAGTNQTALLQQALGCCLDVLHGKILRDDEKADLFWTREAGLRAARLAESLQEWLPAVRVYEELQRLFPALSSGLEKSRLKAQQQLDRGKS